MKDLSKDIEKVAVSFVKVTNIKPNKVTFAKTVELAEQILEWLYLSLDPLIPSECR